jgi:hypothetical protein
MEEYKKGDRVIMQDGSTKRGGTVVEDGIDSKNRVRVRPDGIPMDMSISLTPNNTTYII